MKWSGGPIVARAIVRGFRQIDPCTSEQLRDTTKGFKLYDLADYWETRPPVFFAMTIYLENETWLDPVIESGAAVAEKVGSSWTLRRRLRHG